MHVRVCGEDQQLQGLGGKHQLVLLLCVCQQLDQLPVHVHTVLMVVIGR